VEEESMSKARTAALALTLLICFASEGQEPKPNHYKFWKVKPIAVSARVSLMGQFDGEKEWRADLLSINFLGNPVDKNKEGIPNEKLHLVAYALRAARQPVRTVVISNQFTRESVWRLGRPAWLLVPADKVLRGEPGEPPKGDHYVCYVVVGPRAFSRPVTLRDQFDARMKRTERIERLTPAYFCVPVQKRFRETTSRIIDPATHLAIYRIAPAESLARPIVALTRDQFGAHRQQVLGSELLAVPSIKRKWD
jgi:hypothetical protein